MEFSVDDGGLPKVVYGLRVAVESRTHGLHVPACDLRSWSLLLSSWMFAWCWVLQPACRFCLSSMHPMKQTGCGGVVPYSLGLPGLRRAVTTKWNPRIPPTVESNPWRPALRQTSLDLSPVDCCSPCCAYAGAAKMEWPLHACLGR